MASEGRSVELFQGTLHLILLRALSTMGPLHAYVLVTVLRTCRAIRCRSTRDSVPALVRLEQQGLDRGKWQNTESNREAKFYSITKSASALWPRRSSAGTAWPSLV